MTFQEQVWQEHQLYLAKLARERQQVVSQAIRDGRATTGMLLLEWQERKRDRDCGIEQQYADAVQRLSGG